MNGVGGERTIPHRMTNYLPVRNLIWSIVTRRLPLVVVVCCVTLGILVIRNHTDILRRLHTDALTEQLHTGEEGNYGDDYNHGNDETSRWQSEQKRRRRLLHEKCLEFSDGFHGDGDLHSLPLSHLLVDDRHKFIYCYIPKVGCTSIKRLLGQLAANISTSFRPHFGHALRNTGIRPLSSYSNTDIIVRLRGYTSFMFVRHPLERLLSAYRNKFERSTERTKHFHRKYGTEIIKKHRRNPTSQSLRLGNDVRFGEFVTYLTETTDKFDVHWSKYTHHCRPCSLNYDYIGKLETMNMDLKHIIGEEVLLGNIATAKYANTSHTLSGSERSSVAHLEPYYREIPVETLKTLREIYSKDFELFGYPYEI